MLPVRRDFITDQSSIANRYLICLPVAKIAPPASMKSPTAAKICLPVSKTMPPVSKKSPVITKTCLPIIKIALSVISQS
jgi:hypothetical protein